MENGANAPVADAPAEDAGAEVVEAVEIASTEDLAKEMGWAPAEEWRGNPDEHKNADEFLRDTVNVNRTLHKNVKGLEKQMRAMASTSATITAREVEKARETALEKRSKAFDEGDAEAFNEADAEVRTLDQTPAAPPPPEIQDFAEKHKEWFDKDRDATQYAVNLGEKYAGLPMDRMLKLVEEDVARAYPEYFKTEEKPKAANLSQPGARAAAPSKKGFAQLPADAKKAALDYEKRIEGFSKEDYAKSYFEEFEDE